MLRALTRPITALLLATGCTCGGALQQATAGVDVPKQVELPAIYADEESVGVVSIRSTGTGAILVSALSPSVVTLDPVVLPYRLGGGGVLDVTVRWRPGVAATLDGALEITTDQAPDAPVRVALVGSAIDVPACDDLNPCTDDTFDRNLRRCVATAHARDCDDGSACTGNDRCEGGACRGTALRCDDDDVCTLDFCDPARGCVHPPDPSTCDDQDPCTADVCDRVRGCSHPNAPDGTACGPFSCAEAQLCVFGTCRPLDVRGASNGFPCFDGDLCTTEDACDEGECVGGPRMRSEPVVKGGFVTYGGAGQVAATDGERFLFVAPTHVVVAQRELSGQLRAAGHLDEGQLEFPVALGGGHFAVARGNRLFVIDASNADAPFIMSGTELFPITRSTVVGDLFAATGGVYVHVREFVTRRAGYVQFVPVSSTFDVGPPVPLPFGDDVRLFDADGSSVAWVDGEQAAWWARLNPQMGVIAAGSVFSPTGAPLDVAVEGNLLAVRGGEFVRLEEFDPVVGQFQPVACRSNATNCRQVGPSCSGGFPWSRGSYVACDPEGGCADGLVCQVFTADGCPDCDVDCAGTCCTETRVPLCVNAGIGFSLGIRTLGGVTDLTISDRTLLWSSPAGLNAEPIPTPLGPPISLEPQRLDPTPYGPLRRSGTHVVASGPIAMPFERANDADGLATWRRISGPAHGDVVGITDGPMPTEVVVAGRSSIGALDLLTMQVSRWDVIPTLPSPSMLRGPSRTARLGLQSIQESPTDDTLEEGECAGVDAFVLNADGTNRNVYRLCGAQVGQRLAVAGDLLWADPPSGVLGVALSRTAPMAYDLSGAELQLEPVHRASEETGSWWYVDLRGEDTTSGLMSIRIPEDVDALVELAGHDTGSVTPAWVARPGPSRREFAQFSYASDGALLLQSYPDDLRLLRAHAPTPQGPVPPDELAQASFLVAEDPRPRRLDWMGRGRAWTSSRRGHETRPESLQYLVEQFSYDGVAGTLVQDGEAVVPGAVRSIVDAGVVTLVATDLGLTVVAPACR